ncbi:MAG: hypothetical protein KAG14_01600 [Mycoplasmataceae bacterium]|nr:hypothetical protein [Mycoplasmataceae bacterium]
MYKWENALFDTLGTNTSSYIQRFVTGIGNSKEISIDQTEGNYLLLNGRGEIVIDMNTKNTGIQCIATLEAFGLIDKKIGGYKVVNTEFDFNRVSKSIFEYSKDKKVQKIRQSRIISFLAKVGMINKKNFASLNIVGKRGPTKFEAIIRETSVWEKEAGSSMKNIKEIFERIEKYEFNR